jgi:hypothetical protein
MSELRTISFILYRTPGGAPTCALNAKTAEFCRFLGIKSFGSAPFCLCGEPVELYREPKGYLEPHPGCDLWANHE